MVTKIQNKEDLLKFIFRKGLFIRIPIPPGVKHLEPEIALGRAVLDQALLDSLENPLTARWFNVEDEGFNTICFIAYLEPTKVVNYFNGVFSKLTDEQK